MILTYGESERGLVRKANEDAINLSVENLYILADGMGGYDGGQIAGTLAVERVGHFFSASLEPAFSEESLKEAFYAANRAILNEKKDHPEWKSMGTTLAAAALSEGRVLWAHVGDSRLYRFQDGRLEQITTDHSFVMELVNEGKLSREEMRVHPRKNEITRAVGIGEILEVDTGSFDLKDGTFLLLCSDGVSGMVEDCDLESLIASSPRKTKEDLKELGRHIMDKVYETGAKDNASFILIQYWN